MTNTISVESENSSTFSFLLTDISTQETTEITIPASLRATLSTISDDDGFTPLNTNNSTYNNTDDKYNLFNFPLISPNKLFDEDTRVKVNTSISPYKSIGYLKTKYENSDSYYRGTAYLVGSHIAITAAHCAYSRSDGGATSMTFSPARDGDSYPYGTANVTKYAVLSEYKNGDDWAILILDSNIGDVAGTITFGKYNTATDCLGIGSVISGYPVDKGYSQYGANGYINSVSDYKVWYTIDTEGGQSGSPIMDANRRAYGVHTGGSKEDGTNWGCRVNDRFYDLVQYAFDNY